MIGWPPDASMTRWTTDKQETEFKYNLRVIFLGVYLTMTIKQK
jgi:hypothetical protein